jgi:hypothetical protein
MPGRERRFRSAPRVACVAAVACASLAPAQDSPPIEVLAFDRRLINWADPVEAPFEFPDASLPVSRVTLTIQLDCPQGGCDPWDRSASVFVQGRGPSGRMEQFEIARFITPYGRGCSWDVDVTDYRLFLAGSARVGVFIDTFIGGDRGWLVTLRFRFEPGAPAREVLSVENLWRGKPVYGDPESPMDGFFAARSVNVDPAASAVKLRFFVTGHGQGNTDNAAEFARKLHSVQVNGDRFEHFLWRDDCERNPCSPQAGTWEFDRAGWCPGDDAPPWDVDVTASVVPGEAASVLYEVEPFTNRCRPTAGCTSADCIWGDCNFGGDHTAPIYWVESQCITYRSILGAGSSHNFRQGEAGYAGTVDTMLVEADPGSDRSEAAQLAVDGDDPGGSRKRTQVLIRFDGIFGEAPGRIRPGSVIRRAVLQLVSRNPGTGAAVHRLRIPWEARSGWSAHGGGIRPGVQALAEADAIVSAAGGGTVDVDVSASLDAWSSNPCLNHGWVFLPTGDDGWTFDASEGVEPPRLIVETSRIVDDPVIVVGDVWSYFKGTAPPPGDWNLPGFVPGPGWLAGPTGLGYEDDDDATVLGDMQGSYASVFCRREFRAGPLVRALRLKVDYDDGFAAYLNGTEVARSASLSPPGQPIAWNRLAESREAGALEIHDIPASLLIPGVNVLAVQVHNSALDSSDLSILPALSADSALLAPGSRWRFLRGSRPLPAAWKDADFDDSAWEEGRAGIGYGDGDDATELLDMQGSYGAVFCRGEFFLEPRAGSAPVVLRILHDDGAVLFVNGTEVARLNMPAGTVTPGLLASSAVEAQPAAVSIPAGLLASGRNVIAVSVHNAALDSSDLSFDALVHESMPAIALDCESVLLRGDGDGDGTVTITDAVFTLNFLFLGGVEPGCPDAADADDDGGIQITDAVYVLNFLFLGGAPIPDPSGPECGPDPTEDALGCLAAPACS